jgi:glycosyltransferase involved in cell wall biosynthesis
MKIAYIAAGAAGMYCGSCLRDNAVAAELMRLGEDVLLLPLYTPLRLERGDVQSPAVFYGGINIYLQQKFAWFRKPRAVDRLLDSPRLLKLTNYLAGSTNAADLGDLTLSTLRGDEGFQRKELERLARWLADEYRPDVINLPNSMFVGAARMLGRLTRAPVVCSLTGEDLFLDELKEPWRARALATLKSRSGDVDRFIATSAYYADHMAAVLDVDRTKIDVVPLGLDSTGFPDLAPRREGPFSVGYLARLAPEKGFHLLADAFVKLKAMPGTGNARLVAAGFVSAKDRAFVRQTLAGLTRQGFGGDVDFRGEVTFAEKIRFLGDLDVLSVPTVYREPKGLFVLEALAAGVPVVQPAHGAFPELLEATGGGDLFPPGDTTALAERLHALALDHDRRRALGAAGARAVREQFTASQMALRTRDVYTRVLPA